MQKPGKKFYSAIDTWRALAALLVCIFHFSASESVHGPLFNENHPIRELGKLGYLGVYIFFVISGFVIPLSMYYGKYSYSKIARFIAKRSLRIEPPYIVSILFILLLGFYFAQKANTDFHFSAAQLLANVSYTVPFWEGMEWYNSIFWTLAIEFQFYLICAVIFPLWTHHKKWVRHASLLLFLGSSWLCADNRFVVFYAAIFGFGISLFLLRAQLLTRYEYIIYIVLFAIQLFTHNTIEIFLASILSWGALSLPDFKFRIGTWLGKISYSLYLTHGLAGGYFLSLKFSGNSSHSILFFVAALAISIVFAAVFHYFIEKPFQSLSHKIKL